MLVIKIKDKNLFIQKGSAPHIKIVDLQNATTYHNETSLNTSMNSHKFKFYLNELKLKLTDLEVKTVELKLV